MAQTAKNGAANEQLQDGDIVVLNLRELAEYKDSGPGVRILSDTGASRVVLFTFKAGQTLKEHTTSSQILVQTLRGSITFTAHEKSVRARAGILIELEARVPHSILAHTNAVVLVTMTPSPAQHTLEHGVFEKLTPLVVRAPETQGM